jgi:ATP-dependent DNA helicase RecG
MDMATPLAKVIGGSSAKALASALNLHTIEDLLRHYPRRYVERGELTDLRDLRTGEHVTVMAQIVEAHTRPMKSRRGSVSRVVVTDGRGRLAMTFFNLKPPVAQQFAKGRVGLFSGELETYHGELQFAHPAYYLMPWTPSEKATAKAEAFTRPFVPVYPTTRRFPSWRIDEAVRIVLDSLDNVPDPLPPAVREQQQLVDLRTALSWIHRPNDRTEIERAKERLRFEEAFVLQTELARRRAVLTGLPAMPRRRTTGGLLDSFDARLPFPLTAGQRSVGAEIEADLAKEHPMHRLLQGEVGAGKTVVALRAMLTVVDAGGQAALLAPTEVLAQQHFRSITALLGPLAERGFLGGPDVGTRVALVTGSQAAATRRRTLLEVASGDAGIVIGTHALLEEHVEFADLGLVVIDEQHRFGVEQRAALAAKGSNDTRPHVLVMTATPIPRTVAMTVFGDLEASTLRELPAGRADVDTYVVPTAEKPSYVERIWTRIREEVAARHQVYVVCPRIGDDDADDELEPLIDSEERGTRRPASVLEVAELLRTGPLAGLRLETLHGRMPADLKDDVMRRFAAGEVDVLVATTVIEVGVDVARATVMVVLDADRYGVSQLHQLRGRVGRGAIRGLCLLVTDSAAGSPARERLDAVAATRDGFRLSRVDLAQRREGDVLGVAQSGRRSSLRLLSVLRDERIIAVAREAATEVVVGDPRLWEHPALASAVAKLADEERAEYLERG